MAMLKGGGDRHPHPRQLGGKAGRQAGAMAQSGSSTGGLIADKSKRSVLCLPPSG